MGLASERVPWIFQDAQLSAFFKGYIATQLLGAYVRSPTPT